MKSNRRWLSFSLPFLMAILFCGLSSLALGQGPVLRSLPTPTPISGPVDPSSDQIGGAGHEQPDLIVTSIEFFPPRPHVSQPTVISVTIKNDSDNDLAVGNNFFTDLYIDPPFEPQVRYHQIISPTLGLPWGVQASSVPAGASLILTTTWIFTDAGIFEIWAQVDSDNTVVEVTQDNNIRKSNVRVFTAQSFNHSSHRDFLTNMASTLDNDDPSGKLRLGHFIEPPFFNSSFANFSTCEITSTTVISAGYDLKNPDFQLNGPLTNIQIITDSQVLTGSQTNPYLLADGQGVVIALWEDGRNNDIFDRDIYLRYSTDSGLNWQPEIRVNDDPIGNDQRNPVAALSDNGLLLVAWQDFRNGDWDIYTQQYVLSGPNLNPSGTNILVGGTAEHNDKAQINPDIAVDEAGGFHIVWQDKRHNNYDIFYSGLISFTNSYTWTRVRQISDPPGASQQVEPAIAVLEWSKVVSIAFTVDPTPPFLVTINQTVFQTSTTVVVVWEDDRNGESDIAMVFSDDGGETFAVDRFITNSSNDGDQHKPDVILTNSADLNTLTFPLPNGSTADIELELPTGRIHTVWEGYKTPGNLDRDVYYNLSQLSLATNIAAGDNFEAILDVGGVERINKGDARPWQTKPVDQSNPAVAAVLCGQDTDDTAWNVFMTWADGRNYDNMNYDIYYDLKSTCGAAFGSNRMLNDGVRLHAFTDTINYGEYNSGNPPPAIQGNPSVAADISLKGVTVISGGYLYLAWEDDRVHNPQSEKDIYFARSNLTFFNQIPGSFSHGAGSQISNILDSEAISTTWFTLNFTATTPNLTYVTVQTRLGDTITEVLASAWYPQRFPYQPQPWDCSASSSGAPLAGYHAPGQHIEDAAGNFWPQGRYIQYRVNFFTRDSALTPELDGLTIYYGDPGVSPVVLPPGGITTTVYVPIILK